MKLKWILFIATITFLSSSVIQSQNKKLVVGTKIAEPFVIKTDSSWAGIAIDLWEGIADELNIEYEIKQYDLEGLLNAVANKEIDIAVSPLTITYERETLFDFTHSYFTTGLSIAALQKEGNSFLTTLKNIFTVEFLEVILVISLVLFIVGFLVWLFERKKNK